MNNEELQKLKTLAQAATPGRWIRLFGERTVYDVMEDGCRGIAIVRADSSPPMPQEAANLDFIAAANPAIILELIAIAEKSLAAPTAPSELPTVPMHINALITAYGDARADMDGSPKALAVLIKGLREWCDVEAVSSYTKGHQDAYRSIKPEPAAQPFAYGSSTRKNCLLSKAQFDNCAPKNRAEYDIPLYAAAQALRPEPPRVLTHEQIREAGGIVHKDGNIFFTNLDKLNRAVALAQPEIITDGPAGWRNGFQRLETVSTTGDAAIGEKGNG